MGIIPLFFNILQCAEEFGFSFFKYRNEAEFRSLKSYQLSDLSGLGICEFFEFIRV